MSFVWLLFMLTMLIFSFCYSQTPILTIDWSFVVERDGLYLFAAGGEEKTEKASSKKLSDAKKKGEVPKSSDVNSAISLLVAFSLMMVFGPVIVEDVKGLLIFFFENGSNSGLVYSISDLIKAFSSSFLRVLIFIFVPMMLSGIVTNVSQTGFLLTGESLKPKFDKLNPINGFKEMFSQRRLFDLFKNLAKLTVVVIVSVSFVSSQQESLMELPYIDLYEGISVFGAIIQGLILRVVMLMLLIAAVDYGFQRYDFMKRQKMTKQEVKEEYKQSEGDPFIKSMRRQRQRQLAMSRMMASVPEATVIVTNPTHFAVAIKYDIKSNALPKVVAKGLDLKAQKIKEIAKENKVPVIENKPLARTLYKMVEVDQDIPAVLYQAVADLLSIVYKMQNGKKFK